MPTVVLVEGDSDERAVSTLARRLGRELGAEGVSVVAMGGATNIRRYADRLTADGVRLAGLYDAPEERFFRRALGDPDVAARGFFRCDADLEDELIRSLGIESVLDVIESNGDLTAFRTLQKQPAQRARAVELQLRRFMGSGSGRKIVYAGLLVEALPLERVPRPLSALLDWV